MDKSIEEFQPGTGLPHAVHVEAARPLLWIRLGWEDLVHNPGVSLSHGFLLVGAGWLILLLTSTHVELVAAAVSGFLLVGPVFAAAFYELSRLRAAGLPTTFDASLDGAIGRGKSLVTLGTLLAVLALCWVWLSGILFEQAFHSRLPSISESSWRTVLDWDYPGFYLVYLSTGAIFALLAFVLSAVSAPMLFDRRVDTKTAVLTSIRSIAVNPAAMAVWAFIIAVLTAVGFATLLAGLVIILPLLGHATWHAYRDLIV